MKVRTILTLIVLGVGIMTTVWTQTWAQQQGGKQPPPERTGQVAKPRWEYKALLRMDVEELAPEQNGGSSLPGADTTRLTQGLNALGSDGWEMVAIEPYHLVKVEGITNTNIYEIIYIFRRQE
jgi:hypothetical protein